METRSKRPKPVAECSRCRMVQHDDRYINKRCYKQIQGRRCEGVFVSMLGEGDWKECQSCGATGRDNGGRCMSCDWIGWINTRDK